MFDLVAEGLKIQQLTINANELKLTDEDVKSIKESGLRLVNRPDKAPVIQLFPQDEAA